LSRTIMLIPTGARVGLTSISLGVTRAIERKGVRLCVFKPVFQQPDGARSTEISAKNRANAAIPAALPLTMEYVEAQLRANRRDVLMEEIVAAYHENKQDADVVLIEGLKLTGRHDFISGLNQDIARALNAEVVLVTTLEGGSAAQLKARLELVCAGFGGAGNRNIAGVIINKWHAPLDELDRARPDLSELFDAGNQRDDIAVDHTPPIFTDYPVTVLGCIPWNYDLIATRAIDMARHLSARIINAGDARTRRVQSVTFCARSLSNMVRQFRPGSLLVTCADRPEVLVAACLAAMNGVAIGAVVLTGGYPIAPEISSLCERAFQTGLPVFMVDTNTWQTSLNLQSFNLQIPADDLQRLETVQNYTAGYIEEQWIDSLSAASERSRRLSPPAFRYALTEWARQANKRIVLPEGEDARTISAAAICAERGIARCVLLGNPEEIRRVAAAQGVVLNHLELLDPVTLRHRYLARLVKLRKHKGMTEVVAHEQLEDNVMLGTLMLECGDVDGLVSGAVHTTANTLRPALQLIKPAPGNSLVSSIFFMLLPEQVLVYGDCAINPDPDAEQLSEIAIQSADSAVRFGIEPRVAMISYSTGVSGSGSDVEKVREATRLVRQKRPDLMIDGPLQYDAAIMADVARTKAPDSPVAGRATVFIFPDLNTGNTTYKAVQRSAALVSIGPMLQGLRKPVNDLSRGALVDDIVYTIALTAVQSAQQNSQATEQG